MIEKKQTDMIKAETSKQSKQRKSKEELKQSTKSCKIYCGVEHSRARCFKKVRENFQTRLNIFCVWGSNIFCI